MTEIQCLSHQEQVEAHRRAFLAWWEEKIKPMTHPADRPQSMHQHWQAYLAKHQPKKP